MDAGTRYTLIDTKSGLVDHCYFMKTAPRYALHNHHTIKHAYLSASIAPQPYTLLLWNRAILSRTPYSSASSTCPHPPLLPPSDSRNSSSAPRPVSHYSAFSLPDHCRRRCLSWPRGLCSRSRTLYRRVADRVLKKEGEGGGSKLRRGLRRKGWMRCVVVRTVPGGRMSRVSFDVVVVEIAAGAAAGGVLVFGSAVVGSAVALSRRPS